MIREYDDIWNIVHSGASLDAVFNRLCEYFRIAKADLNQENNDLRDMNKSLRLQISELSALVKIKMNPVLKDSPDGD